MDSKKLGELGEKTACEFLQKKGYKILDRNYSFFVSGPQKGEIDIIAEKNDTISFVEVKTLTSDKIIRPEEKVDFIKQRKIIKSAQSWLIKNNIPLDSKWQIDIVAIKMDILNNKARIRHFQNAAF